MAMLALAAALPGAPVAAQSLALYGTVDAGVTLSRSGAPGARTIKSVGSGTATASRWGIRGSEDLGGGMAAIFQLEAGLDLDTGAAKTFSGNPSTATPTAPNGTAGTGFNRRSFVGIQGPFGTLALGRDYTPVYHTGLAGDIMRYALLGNLQEAAPLAGGSERWARVSNAIFYTSPQVAGITGRVAYSLGSEGAGGGGGLAKRANQFIGLGAQYSSASLMLAASYQELSHPLTAGAPAAFTGAVAKRKDGLLAARYTFGSYAVSGGHLKIGQPQNSSDTWLGASADIGLGTLYAQVQRLRQGNTTGTERQGTVFGLAYLYNLSRRSALYASYGQVCNGSTASFALVSSDNSVAAGGAGADPQAFSIGVRHNF